MWRGLNDEDQLIWGKCPGLVILGGGLLRVTEVWEVVFSLCFSIFHNSTKYMYKTTDCSFLKRKFLFLLSYLNYTFKDRGFILLNDINVY